MPHVALGVVKSQPNIPNNQEAMKISL